MFPKLTKMTNKAVYTATEVACGWAGAKTARKRRKKLTRTDQPTDLMTDRLTWLVIEPRSTRLKMT